MGYGSANKGQVRKKYKKANKQEHRLDKTTWLVRLAVVCTLLLGVLAIVLIISSYRKSLEPSADENWAAKWAYEDSKNYEGIYVHGGNYKTFSALDSVVRAYFNYYKERDLYSMYNDYYANHALSVYGYSYPYEDYTNELDLMANMYHLYKSDEDYVNMSYKAVTYQDYTNYYLFTFNLQFTYMDSKGEIVSTPVMEHIYTIIPYESASGEIYYKLLDFNISDIGVLADRFKKIEKED